MRFGSQVFGWDVLSMTTTEDKIDNLETKIVEAKIEQNEERIEKLEQKGFENPNHPVWKLGMLVVCCLTILGIFALMANDFSLDDILRFVAIIPIIISAVYNTNILKALSQKQE